MKIFLSIVLNIPLIIYRKCLLFFKIILNKEVFYFIQIKIPTKFIGSKKYGGWSIFPRDLTPGSIIYSFGVGENIDFELGIMDKYNCPIYAFDPTPKSIDWIQKQRLPNNFNFYKFGIGNYNGKITFYPPKNSAHVSHSIIPKTKNQTNYISVPVRTLKTIMKKLNHDKIDILKMDIEGSEYNVIKNILKSNLHITQILIEFHHRFPGISADKTRNAIRLLNKKGYKIFAISPSREEYSFIKINK